MHSNPEIEFHILPDDLLETKPDEEIKKTAVPPIVENNHVFQLNFIHFMTFLKKNEIFAAVLVVNKQFSKFSKSIDFWLKIYLSRLDMHLFYFTNYSKNYLNKLACLLHDAIKADFFDLLFDENYQRSWNLDLFFSLKMLKMSSLLLKKTQLSLKLPYLIKAKTKKKYIEEKVKSKIEELKEYTVEKIQFPSDELQAIGSMADEKNRIKLIKREKKFLKFFETYKNIIYDNLEIYKEKFVKEKLDYLKFYFKILFWDSKENKLDTGSEEFYQIFLAQIPRYKIDMSDGSDENNDHLKKNSSDREKITGLELAVEMGNLHALESCSKTIQSYLNLKHVFKAKLPKDKVNNFPEQLLATAAYTGQEAIMQFLFDQGVQPERDSKQSYNYCPAINNAILRNQYHPAMLLIAQGAGVHVIPCDGRKPLRLLCSGQNFYMLSLLILCAGNVDLDDELFESTLLGCLARSVWPYLAKLGSIDKSKITIGNNDAQDLLEEIRSLILHSKKEKDEIAKEVNDIIGIFRGINMVISGSNELSKFSHYQRNLEVIRLTLILGADPTKVKNEKEKQVIDRIMPIITDKERKEGGQFSPSSQKISYIKNFSFIKKQKKENQCSLLRTMSQ